MLSTINIRDGYMETPKDLVSPFGAMGLGLPPIPYVVCLSFIGNRGRSLARSGAGSGLDNPPPSRPLLSDGEPGNQFQLHLISRSNILSEIIHVPPLFLTHFPFSS